jgi:hypothetical protein
VEDFMKRAASFVGLALVAAGLAVVVSGQGRHRGQQDVYFGYLLGSPRLAGVAFDVAAPDRNGKRLLRAYVCDGLGVPDGMAVWFKGEIPADLESATFPASFTSVGGQETLTITVMNDRRVLGVFSEASGARASFASYPAIDGAGIYQVTLDEGLRYTGISTDGARLDAQANGEGTTVGTIKPAQGKAVDFTVHSLALASPGELAAYGLSQSYLDYAAFNQVPGSYVAVIAPGGSHWFGRSGAVQLGRPGLEIIGLDKKEAR